MNRLYSLLLFLLISGLIHRADAADATRGASLPWLTYEAEHCTTNGAVLGPDYTGHSPMREASGRRCVSLARTGDFVQFTVVADAQGMVVRYSIPNSADGRGEDATLTLYINGQPRTKLPMTSRMSYLYGQYPFTRNPAAGTPRHFWDEVRLMPGQIRRGDVVRLQKDADDSAKQTLIDLIDLEAVPTPLARPANSVSVTDFGAKADGRSHDRPAFLAAIADARTHHQSVWIPPGRYLVEGPLRVGAVAIQGAGIWYSTLVGADDYTPDHRIAILGNGSNITLSDFSIIGKLNYRNDSEANDGLGGSFGTGSIIRNIWVEHTKTGAWLVNADGLLIEGCRFRNTMADGINLCAGMHNTLVRNCSARGTGDDCFAIWPATYTRAVYPSGSNRFVNCTAQLPYLAQAFAIYGGDANTIENCAAVDIPYGAGLFASTTFPTEFGFRGTTTYRQINITRAGDRDGSIGIVTDLIDLSGLRFEDIDVIDSATSGIEFRSLKGHALADAALDRIRIVDPGMAGEGSGIVEARGALGSATIRNVTIINPRTNVFQNDASGFNLIRDAQSLGLGSEQRTNADFVAARQMSAGK